MPAINRNRRLIRHAACVLGALLLTAGCSSNRSPRPGKPAASAPISNTDPCAMRLHDLAGGLLMYQLEHNRLPERLDELKGLPVVPGDVEFVCPVSHQPYLYTSQGLSLARYPGVMVLCDPAPSHAGMRWAVFLLPPAQVGEPMVTKVIAVQEKLLPRR
jgi:hypothetical protein